MYRFKKHINVKLFGYGLLYEGGSFWNFANQASCHLANIRQGIEMIKSRIAKIYYSTGIKWLEKTRAKSISNSIFFQGWIFKLRYYRCH